MRCGDRNWGAAGTAIANLHQDGIIHSDITPRNIVRTAANSWKLIDLDKAFRKYSIGSGLILTDSLTCFSAPHRPITAPCVVGFVIIKHNNKTCRQTRWGGHVWHMLIGACNPTVCPIHVIRSLDHAQSTGLPLQAVNATDICRSSAYAAPELLPLNRCQRDNCEFHLNEWAAPAAAHRRRSNYDVVNKPEGGPGLGLILTISSGVLSSMCRSPHGGVCPVRGAVRDCPC